MKAYLPDDYIRSHQLTFAVDTFCFGIFMFELVCARCTTFPNNNSKTYQKE